MVDWTCILIYKLCLYQSILVSGLVSYPGNKLLSTNNADTRHVGICGSYYSDVFHRFSHWPCSSPLSSTYRRCHAGRRVRERKARNIHRTESLISYPRASREEAIICIKDPFQITPTSSHLWSQTITYPLTLLWRTPHFIKIRSLIRVQFWTLRSSIEDLLGMRSRASLTTSLKMTSASAPLPRPGWMNFADFVRIA